MATVLGLVQGTLRLTQDACCEVEEILIGSGHTNRTKESIMAMGACSGCGHHKNLYGAFCAECIGDGRHRSVHQRAHYGEYAGPMPGVHQKQHHMTAAQRARVPTKDFALPHRNPPALPLRDPSRPGSDHGYVTAATARLQMMHNNGTLRPGEYAEGKRHILAAARRLGMHSTFERS